MWWDFTTLQRKKGSQTKRNWLGGSGKGSIFPRLSPPQNLLLPPCAESSKCLPWADCSLGIRGVTLGRRGSWDSHGVRTRKSPGDQTALVPYFSEEKTTVPRAMWLASHTANSPKVTSVLLVSTLLHKFSNWAKKIMTHARGGARNTNWGGGWTHRLMKAKEYVRVHGILTHVADEETEVHRGPV